MIISDKSYHPIHSVTLKAIADMPAFRFVGFDGDLCENESKALGVSEIPWIASEKAAIVTMGTMLVESGGTINVGENVTSDSTGRAKLATAGMTINGRALSSATIGQLVKILIVQ